MFGAFKLMNETLDIPFRLSEDYLLTAVSPPLISPRV